MAPKWGQQSDRSRVATNVWTARTIPFVLAGVVGYATYVVVALLCANYLLAKHHDHAAAIPILVVYFVLFILMASSYLRLCYITIFDPPYLPLGQVTGKHSYNEKRPGPSADSIGCGEYDGMERSRATSTGTSSDSTDNARTVMSSRNDPDSPGLELFYTKDVFACERDGRPRWCNECRNWKPDRTHHCSDAGRCIQKMDHFCPWVGGPVGENNFKFFIQFTSYTALYCANVLVVMALYISRQTKNAEEQVNSQFIAVLALAAFFGLFTGSMASQSFDLAVRNLTTVERLKVKRHNHMMAVLKPLGMSLQVPHTEVTYPLARPTTAVCPPDSVPRSLEGNVIHQQAQQQTPRDLRATRTFAVLDMTDMEMKGELRSLHPWDLGSWLLNWKTVMGDTVIDWVIPIRRSPCCKHDDPESHFPFGPAIDALKQKAGIPLCKEKLAV